MAKKKKVNQSPGLFDEPKTPQELKMEGVQNLGSVSLSVSEMW